MLEKHNPMVFHIGCHGDSEKLYIPWSRETSIERKRLIEDLVDYMKVKGREGTRLKCIVLNACETQAMAEAMIKSFEDENQHHPFVVCWQSAIDDSWCAAFAENFYYELTRGDMDLFDKRDPDFFRSVL